MRYDAEHKARTRERVLKEAVKAIRSEGPVQIAVAGVMARAGLTHGGFYAHFKSKDELVMAAIDQMFASATDNFTRRTEGLEPAAALRAYIGFYLSRGHRDARDMGCALPLLSSDLPRMTDEARARFAAGVARLTARLAELFAKLGRPDPEPLAASVLSEMVGALGLARAIGPTPASDAILQRSQDAVLARLGVAAA